MAQNLHSAFVDLLRDIYFAEKQLTKAIPKMAKAAENDELTAAFEGHAKETITQVEQLEKVFGLLDLKPRAKTCEAIKGLIEEGEEIIEENDAGCVRDALLIAAAQKVEHYEIATYGTMCQWAEVLDLTDVKKLIGAILDEEESTDKKLTKLASSINKDAAVA
ncbi:hypothetical protein Poly30_35050 [Planctomycetes bacterium Poly30]|uniref:Uncharacterized protein n=1 Tax=Saltatorellus ferox TaxID=2528018 RepID=A0A518EV45_9BACT|nr:hypothetical protein Poly30_35050 [Planctomycetes bacterium Poly30]